MAQLKVIDPGFHCTLQDQGRTQCQQLGLAEAGAMDKHAFFWGNKLLGNQPDTPSLEILVGNASFEFECDSYIALTGADMQATLNDKPIPYWKVTPVKAGDILKLGIIRSGLRAYLSIKDGFQETKFFKSISTVEREQTGGNNGSKIKQGDRLNYTKSDIKLVEHKVPKRWRPDYDKELTLRFTPSYHFNEFSKESIENFLKEDYCISNEANRMGYRLTGPKLARKGKDILSIGVPCGAIQIPPSGEPIILLNDRQCTGGYPILGVIAQQDIYQLSQRKNSDKVRFKKANLEELKKESQEFYEYFYNRQWRMSPDFLPAM